jgi:hypothetical protein
MWNKPIHKPLRLAHPRSNAPLHLYNFNSVVVPFFLLCPFGGSDLLSFLSAKIEYSPPLEDLAAQGFPLEDAWTT